MSEDNQNQNEELTPEEQAQLEKEELKLLKKRADQIGVSYSPNIGLDKLRERVEAKLNGDTVEEEAVPEKKANETKLQRRNRIKKEALKLVRIRITCMNPAKRDYQGEILTVANNVIQDRRFVPFDTPWHVPQIMYNMIKERKYQIFVKKKSPQGIEYKEGRLVPEFAIEVLPPLTKKELEKLAQRQKMASGTSEEE